MRLHSLAVLATLALSSPTSAAEAGRPNILWICADDHAAYVLGAYGNKQVRTPNLDKLAAGGMRFDRAYCNAPVCTASRQSFFTGRYPRTLGVTQLRTALPAGTPTLATMLAAASYHTASIGKMHFNSALTHGFEFRLDLAAHAAHLMKKGRQPLPKGVEVLPPWRPFRDHARTWLNSGVLPYGAVQGDMAATFFADHAVRYLAAKRDKPFFLMVSFYEPHSPFHFPVEYRGRHKPASFTVPKLGSQDEAQIPAIFRGLTEREKQGIIAAYHTSVEFLDHNVGRVLAALERSGQANNTLVVYTGDHGYMLGHHGRFEKHCCYEPAVRAPLLVRWPGQVRPGSTSALVEFVDIAPTLLEACGVRVPATVQGKSLLALLRGKKATHRAHVIVEYSENEEAMIRTDRWKLIYCTGKRARQDGYATGRPLPGRTIQLFDMMRDPEEVTNLASKPEQAARVKALTALLAEHMKKTARQPELLPRSADVHEVLAFCLQPRDVGPAPKKK